MSNMDMIKNKSQLVELLKEILSEKFPKKNKLQKNKVTKNKVIKNKTRKPKKLREENQADQQLPQYQIELVWNREFDFIKYGPIYTDINAAIKYADELLNMGDGERVKKTRIVDGKGNVVWQYGKLVGRVK